LSFLLSFFRSFSPSPSSLVISLSLSKKKKKKKKSYLTFVLRHQLQQPPVEEGRVEALPAVVVHLLKVEQSHGPRRVERALAARRGRGDGRGGRGVGGDERDPLEVDAVGALLVPVLPFGDLDVDVAVVAEADEREVERVFRFEGVERES